MATIRDWPLAERPREKLLARGPQSLSDAELLAIFLRTGVRDLTAVDLARRLLAEFGGLRQLLEADLAAFSAHKGLGPAKYAQLQAVLEMGRRHLWERLQRGDVISSPDDTRRFLLARLQDYPYEVFACLLLDNRHRVIGFEEVFRGTIDAASVYPREIVKLALLRNAAALIVAHNHPSGDPTPSKQDITLTQQLAAAGKLLGIPLADHVIVAKTTHFSFRKNKLL